MRLKSLESLGNPVAYHSRRSLTLTATATLFAATVLVPTAASAHTRRHHHHHRSDSLSQTASTSPAHACLSTAKHVSPVDVAGDYGRTAAMYLAGSVNKTRSIITATASAPVADVGGSFARTAAMQLASNINKTRAAVVGSPASHDDAPVTAHEIRIARHEERVAAREEHHHEHVVQVAEQDEALRSGDVVQAAYSFRGTRYIFGGTSRSGFDCSSFVRYILGHADGVDLPRTAEEQYYEGTPVSREDLQPGDLVFFKNTYRHGISHVGIYTGDGKFVHAANSHKGVREDSLDETYYAEHYAGARRVLGMR